MPIPENQLDTWARQGAVTTSASSYQIIRNALLAAGTGYADKSVEVFLQGSYGNDTNVYAESDVDVVIRLDSLFYYDDSKLDAAGKTAFERLHPGGPAQYEFHAFYADVLKQLRTAFGADVVPGAKAIKVNGRGNRRPTDVLVSVDFRNYHSVSAGTGEIYTRGLCFFTSSGRIENFPKQHCENCTAKHQATNGWFKPTVRILKNMRNRMVDVGLIQKTIAPSYYLEGLLYNVPNDKFGSSYEDTFVEAYNWIVNADRTQFVCAHEEYYLLRDGFQVTWPTADGEAFLVALGKFWKDWQ